MAEKTKITNLQEALSATGITQGAAGRYVGLGKAAVSRVCSHSYPNWESIERQILRAMVDNKCFDEERFDLSYITARAVANVNLSVNSNVFITTGNVKAIDALGEDLLDDFSTLNSSIGMAVGPAGYGKSEAVKHFVIQHDQAAYVLYLEGFTVQMLVKTIAKELTGNCAATYEKNLNIIKDATCLSRKLVVIDEADRMPIRYLEAVRGLNEYCGLPLLLIGEEGLIAKMDSQPRLKSRIRKPQISFHPLNVTDVATYYKQAVGLDISEDLGACTILLKYAKRDFRNLVNDAQHIVQVMNTQGIPVLSKEILNEYYRTRRA